MNNSTNISRLTNLMSYSYLVFAAACTFSIALAQTALGLAVASFIILGFSKKADLFESAPREMYLALAAFVAWIALTSCVGAGGLSGLADIESFWLLLAFPVGWYLLRSSRYRDRLLMVLAIMVLLGGLAGLVQFFTGLNWPGVAPPVPNRTWGYRAQGFFSSRMTFAQVFVPFVLMFVYLGWSGLKARGWKGRTGLYLSAGLAGAIGIVLSLSRSSMLALVIGLLVMGVILGRKQLLVVIILLMTTGLLSWQFVPDFALRIENTGLIDLRSHKVAGRQFIWGKSLEIVKDNLWLGVGRSGFQPEYIKRLGRDFDDHRIPGDAHSDWLHTTATAGVPGLLLLAWLWFTILRHGIRRLDREEKERTIPLAGLVGLLGILVMSVTVSLFEDSEMLQVIILIWLIVLAPQDSCRLKTDNNNPASNRSQE